MPYFAAFFVTRAFLPDMLTRDSGHFVNVTSPSSIVAFPGSAAYAAARRAMHGFSQALRADVRGTGLGVTLVMPGKVSSTCFEHNPGSEERIPKFAKIVPTLTPEQAADAIVDAVERNKQMVVIPLALRMFYLLHRIAPAPVEWLTVRTGWQRGHG